MILLQGFQCIVRSALIYDLWLNDLPIDHLVHWKGYSTINRTWESANNLTNSPEHIKNILHVYPKSLVDRPKEGATVMNLSCIIHA